MQVPVGDNYYAALNSAVFSDGSFVYIPKGVKSSMELSTYFRINAQETGQVGALVLTCTIYKNTLRVIWHASFLLLMHHLQTPSG